MKQKMGKSNKAKIIKKLTASRYSLLISVFAFAIIGAGTYSVLLTSNNSVGNSLASSQEPADINNDNKVDIVDLSILLSNWNNSGTSSDLNSDGKVDIVDLSILLSRWGTTVSTNSSVGAQLPISYNLDSIAGNKIFVATDGNDSSGDGSISAPYATLGRAISASSNNDTIVIRGGEYRDGDITVPSNKKITVIAYPGELPVLNGAQAYTSGWMIEGDYRYKAYTPMPVTDGSGISFSTGQNLTGDGVGKYPDQVWVGDEQIKQVTSKGAVTEGKFWVDRSNNRIYLSSVDVGKGNIEVSKFRDCLDIFAPNTFIQGLKITRYSNTASDYGVIKLRNTADNSTLRDVEISHTAFIALQNIGDNNLLDGVTLQNVTITKSNWMGVAALYTDNLTIENSIISDMNQFDEFTYSPQSGALKTSRTWFTKVTGSEIRDNHSHGLWFDQSNYKVEVANNRITNNLGSGVFFEISDDLLLINNYIKADGGARATRLAGSSGLKIINNTIVGGADVLGIFTDVRSKPGCADPAEPLCSDSYSSDRDTVRTIPQTLDWMPRIDTMYNNIIAYSTDFGWCGNTTFCINVASGSASAPIETIIHQADPERGIPKTYINNNIYANGSNRLMNVSNYSHYSLSSFSSAMASSPVNISGLEANGKAGNNYVQSNGAQTSELSALNSQAEAIPNDTQINKYLPVGYRHYGYKQ